ncbi:GNAT family N-acetyltransferase [Aquimarina sp. U1-2]|uniref:GNAT family N-acetyltransferase n=1 Tax=Aquimarina sp. U1-2 TaxID=2823141 RepID=UPI001AECD618|nr:GNAT family N-acetyltransferase [Aquimarina sp. U1-2]MBP2833407.1 GNAT family N-acetyltransferase [Aquimarina sp. U1-2]
MIFRKAIIEDLPVLIKMIANDDLGQTREYYTIPLPEEYRIAFENIDKDPNQELIVIEDKNSEIIGTLQLSFIQYLTYKGGIRAQIEAVRIREDMRGKRIGQQLFDWAIRRAKEKGAHLLQLTTDKKRLDAIEFYKKLGFQNSHEGMKLHF